MKLIHFMALGLSAVFISMQASADDYYRVHRGSDRDYYPSYSSVRYYERSSASIRLGSVLLGFDSGYRGRSSGWRGDYRQPERVIVYRSSSRGYDPFIPSYSSRWVQSTRYYGDRHSRDRYKSYRREHRHDRGRRNHYK